jgi:CBS domain-containing protein
MPTIDAYMTKTLLTADPGESVEKVAGRMRDAETGAILIMDGSKLVGLLSERDIMSRVVAEGKDASKISAGEVATSNVVSVSSDTSLRQCAEMLRELGARHLPVVDEGQPVGIVSARDFFVSVASDFEQLLGQARYDAQLEANTDPYDHVGGSYGR